MGGTQPANEDRQKCVKVVLEELDRNPGEYHTQQKQNDLLDRLIEKHDLKDPTPGPNGLKQVLTRKRYRDIIGNEKGHYPRKGISDKDNGPVFLKGSAVIDEGRLRVFGLGKDTVATAVGSGEADAKPQKSTSKRIAATPPHQQAPLGYLSVSPQFSPLTARDGGGLNFPEDAPPPLKKLKLIAGRAPDGVRKAATEPKGTQADTPPVTPTPTPPPQTALASRLRKISATDISKSLCDVWTLLQSAAHNIWHEAGIDPNADAVCVLEPTEELETIYRKMFGPEWKTVTLELTVSGALNSGKVLQACLAGAFFNSVVRADLPWDGPKDIMAMLKDEARVMERVMGACGRNHQLDTVVWQAAQIKIEEPEVLQARIQPAAREIAANIMHLLWPQIKRLGAKGDTKASMIQDRIAEVAEIVQKMLVLRGSLRAAPDYYTFSWYRSGVKLDKDCMEEVRQSKGKQKVLWCVSPRVKVKSTENSEWETAVRAKVFTERLEESQ